QEKAAEVGVAFGEDLVHGDDRVPEGDALVNRHAPPAEPDAAQGSRQAGNARVGEVNPRADSQPVRQLAQAGAVADIELGEVSEAPGEVGEPGTAAAVQPADADGRPPGPALQPRTALKAEEGDVDP